MADFIHGEEGSRSKLVQILEAIRSQGSSAIAQLESARLDTLVEFDRRLSAINGRRQRANRVRTPTGLRPAAGRTLRARARSRSWPGGTSPSLLTRREAAAERGPKIVRLGDQPDGDPADLR